MKKYIFFLILVCAIILSNSLVVNAKESRFYEAEYIDGIYMNKSPGTNHSTIYYQKARFFRERGTDKFAYCIEPADFFEENSSYSSTHTPPNLTDTQIQYIKQLAHFGYQYKNHTDPKWYAITQFMIWQTADPNGLYYFTDGLNGTRINNAYFNEMNEIRYLISYYKQRPDIYGTFVEGSHIEINDPKNYMHEFTTSLGTIQGNTLVIDDLKEGTYDFQLYRQDNYYNEPAIFYQSGTSQDLVLAGNLDTLSYTYRIKVIKTNLTINKIDKDNKDSTPQGDAKLEGTTYTIYDSNNNEIDNIIVDKDGIATIDNLNFGKYYLKETKAGTGYIIDPNTYEFEISENNSKVELTLENEVIKNKIVLHKTYGDNDNFNNEKGISFEIYNSNNELVDMITTDIEGITEITLPYGKYKIIQISTTEGYNMIDPIDIEVLEELDNEIVIELKDYKIPVPNTSTNHSLLEIIIKIILLIL